MSNHCRHCDRCRDIWLGAHTNAKGATWPDRCCPACAEAERIAAAMNATAQHWAAKHRANGSHVAAAFADMASVAARIARGEA